MRKKLKILGATLCGMIILSACTGSKKGGSGDFPKDFNARSDEEKTAYIMEAVEPDSVARFIVNAALGNIAEARLKSVGVAYNYAYQHYQNQGDNQTKFIVEFDNVQNDLPLEDKMKIMRAAGQEDPLGLGLKLGLDYFEQLRDKKMTVGDVDAEIAAFRRACGSDTTTYVRFVKGFKAALNTDGGRSIDRSVYVKYRNMPERL